MQFEVLLSSKKPSGYTGTIKEIPSYSIESKSKEVLMQEAEAYVYEFLGRSLEEMINGNTESPKIRFIWRNLG
ncbi:MAG: hypothetical protein JRN20_20435 [Nitrososphaerota archaeon]|nr:hypothetical protein [Nitrososphaerota archaeon]